MTNNEENAESDKKEDNKDSQPKSDLEEKPNLAISLIERNSSDRCERIELTKTYVFTQHFLKIIVC